MKSSGGPFPGNSMEEPVYPYDVFRVDKPDQASTDPELGAYLLPSGEVRVLTNNFGESQILFESREKADAFLREMKGENPSRIVQLNPEDYPRMLTSAMSFEEAHVQATTPQHRVEKDKSASRQGKGERDEDKESTQTERSKARDPDNNRQEKLQENAKEDTEPQRNELRADQEEPEQEYAGGTFLEDVEHWIPSLFEPAHKGISSLKSDLEENLNETNWIGKAIGASFLDVLDTAMYFTEGIPLGLLDTRRIGEGIAEGTWEGVKKDVGRALNVIPQGRVLRAVDRAITVSNVIESLGQGDKKGAVLAAGMAVLAIASKGKGKGGPNRKPPKGKVAGKPKSKNRQTWRDSENETGDFLQEKYPDGEWTSQTRFKNGSVVEGAGRSPRDSTVPDWHNEKMKVAVESKRYFDVLDPEDRQRFLTQAGGRIQSLPPGTKQWLVVDHRGMNLSDQSVVQLHRTYYRSFGRDTVFQKIFIVTEKAIICF